MIKKNILGLLFLLSTLCLFNSCEDDPYYDDRYDLTSALCSGTWSETYTTNNGEDCYHDPNSIYMDFPDGTYSYFEDIQIRGFQLRGILDEIDVILTME